MRFAQVIAVWPLGTCGGEIAFGVEGTVMNRLRYWCFLGLAIGLLIGAAGCVHELRTERLERWNQGVNGMPTSDYD